MLKVIHAGMNRPISRPVDPNATFQPGMIGQHKRIGNEIVLGVSDGIAPFGIIQDLRDVAYVQPVIDEITIIVPTSVSGSNVGADTIGLLRHSNVLQYSYRSNISGVSLVATNGAIVAKAGTPLNYQSDPQSAGFDSVRVVSSYSYYVPNKPGDDTTMGSNKVTLWANPSGCIFLTDQFDTLVPYPLNSPLYVNGSGLLSSQQLTSLQPSVAMVCTPPTTMNPTLEFIWL